jgi:hypothetical protein
MSTLAYALGFALALMLSGCDSVRYVKSELSGTAKPEGGIQENIPPSRTYRAPPQAVRRAVLAVLGDQGYVYEDNPSAGTIKTEPKSLTDTSKFAFTGATYHAKLFITFDGSTVTYRAKFDKKSNLTMPELNVEFPEKENEIRKEFFVALDKRLTPSGAELPQGSSLAVPASSQGAAAASAGPTSPTSPPPATKSTVESKNPLSEPMSTLEMQKILLSLGYEVGQPDGISGRRTVDALRKFQQASKLPVTGSLDPESVVRLRAAARGRN